MQSLNPAQLDLMLLIGPKEVIIGFLLIPKTDEARAFCRDLEDLLPQKKGQIVVRGNEILFETETSRCTLVATTRASFWIGFALDRDKRQDHLHVGYVTHRCPEGLRFSAERIPCIDHEEPALPAPVPA